MSESYSENLKFENFGVVLEREKNGEFHIDVLPSKNALFTSFRFTLNDIQDIINEIESYFSDSDIMYEPSSLDAVLMYQEDDDPPSLEISTDKTFSILYFADDDEVIRFQSELKKSKESEVK